ncbi:TonB-linked SusC/RagA family outer membrane protein [Pedobacter africanus]|uniref:TonB-linked SusC/RagA family outer membrane protein n=1 Tax=Pedobacter africanus TaxID=151894 RepID=A0ACC6KS03_9SPHI|nr:TonB-dependent receptor [Pedobacter africanus]MDR6781970.1 TonB-linked SusC/RagA family outer membrane protein [Pedobacter africanus]
MMKKYLFILSALFFFCFKVSAQTRKITGKVSDEQGKPIPGVAVKPKNNAAGTTTDAQGRFTIAVAENLTQLEFSSVSFVPQTVTISGKTTLSVVLKEDVIGLQEVVAVGYATQTKANLTGAVSTVSVKEVEGRALTSADQILQGKLAGVTIVQSSGRPGDDNSQIRIRGVSSIDNNNDPLVIINGVQANINDVNPNDIESVSVLKDAASAAIYGSRASAGVIIIETKKGNSGKGLQVEYNATGSMVNATRLPETVDAYTYASLLNEARANVALGPVYTQAQLDLFRSQTDPNFPNTNWYDVYYRKAYMQNHYLGLRGGDKNYKFSNSVGYRDQNGILTGTSAKRLSYNTSLSGSFIKNKVRLSLGLVGYSETGKELISATNTVLAEISGSLPTAYVQSIDTISGNPNLYSYPGRFLGAMNLGGGIENKLNSLNSRASVEVEPVKGLIGKFLLSNNKLKTDYVNFTPRFFTSGTYEETSVNLRESSLEKRNTQSDLNTFLATIEYGLKKGKHDFKLLAAHERLEMIYNYDAGSVKNLSSNQPIFNYGDPTSPFLSSAANETATASFFGRLNYSYAGKYLLELNMRRDGSSRFADKRKWGNFPSVSAGWRISEESFFAGLKKNIYLKLRTSWGRLGNQNIFTQYAFADQMSGSEYYAFGNSIVPGRGTVILANKDTRWETTEQFDVGMDLVLWNRWNFTLDYFNKKTFDILARVTIPPSLGVTVLPYQNIGNMVNKGIEMSLGYNAPKRTNKLNYGFTVNASYINNKLTSLGGLPYVDHSLTNRSMVGAPFSSFYGYKVAGIYQVSDFTWQNNSDPSVPHAGRTYVLKPGMPNVSGVMSNPAPGDIKISDVKNDGLINADDKTLIGNPIAKLLYSLSADLSYKNFGLNVIAQGTGKANAYMNGNLIAPYFNTTGPLLQSMVTNRWTIDNPSDKYQRIYVDKGRDALITDYNIYNAAYLRLKSLQLSYTFNSGFTKKLELSRLRLFVSAENLFLVSSFPEGFDPERRATNVTVAFHPQVATYSIGLNLNF